MAEATDGTRGAQTRQLILDTALRLFREQSYDRTTMRAIAAAAGVSVGNAYYYFSGKEELVQAFYAQIQEEHRARAAPALAGSADVTSRLRGVLHAGIDVMEPYHEFAATFIKLAVDPDSPSSPFSAQSAASRAAAVALFREVLTGASPQVPADLRAELPELLWLAHLGVTLFWVHDRSPGQARTRTLIDTSASVIGRLVRLARLPPLRSITADLLSLTRTLRP
jgi:AcrR family transcriptional regulator